MIKKRNAFEQMVRQTMLDQEHDDLLDIEGMADKAEHCFADLLYQCNIKTSK